MKISVLLRKAANEYLRSGFDRPAGSGTASCVAMAYAAYEYGLNLREIESFLASLGCPVYSLAAFNEFPEGPERQCARFSWLHFAALVAEDEGL